MSYLDLSGPSRTDYAAYHYPDATPRTTATHCRNCNEVVDCNESWCADCFQERLILHADAMFGLLQSMCNPNRRHLIAADLEAAKKLVAAVHGGAA